MVKVRRVVLTNNSGAPAPFKAKLRLGQTLVVLITIGPDVGGFELLNTIGPAVDGFGDDWASN